MNSRKTLILFQISLILTIAKLFAGEAMIYELIASNPFVIEREIVEEIKTRQGIDVYQFLQELIPIAKTFARPPISNYQVGIAGLGKSGKIYLGVNLEFAGLPLNEAVHGEQFLVVNARNHGEEGLIAIALSAAPCGHCRQFLNEMGGDDDLLILTPSSTEWTLDSLLPKSFGPQDLGVSANLMSQQVDIPSLGKNATIVEKALQAAYASYAPYSNSKSGVAIQTRDGKIYSGSYLENAAFNPSLSPMQSALVALVAALQDYNEIVHVVLAEQTSCKISQEVMSLHLLRSIAPDAIFETVRF